jgi:Tfp pilus assembly protein PilX
MRTRSATSVPRTPTFARGPARGALSRRQRGGALMVTLIALGVLLIAAVSLLRSTSTASAIAANTASKQAAAEAADVGLQAANVRLTALTNTDSNVTGAYYATQQAVDSSGLLAVDWSSVPYVQVGNFKVQYLIDRLCDAPLPVTDTAAQCSIAPTASESTSHRVGAPLYIPKAPVYYRVTTRTVGPKSSESYVQAVVSK